MSQIVHITFEKLTGLKGDIEGVFLVSNFGMWEDICDTKLPVVFMGDGSLDDSEMFMVFRQNEKYFFLKTIPDGSSSSNYLHHFTYGTNFLIKSWSYGGGVKINSQPPN